MADLTKQLWLGLAIQQTNKQNNNEDYSYSYTNPSGKKSIAVSMSEPWTMELWGGIISEKSPQVSQEIPLKSTATQSFSSSIAPVATPWVTNNTVDSISGIPNKKKLNIGQSATQLPTTSEVPKSPVAQPDMSGFREATAWQDAQFRQSYRNALENKITPIEPTIPSPTWLSGAELQAYNELSPQEQKMFQALSTQGLKAQTDYLTKAKADVEYRKKQEESRVAMEDNSIAMAEMQSAQRIEEAQKSVANMKQNIGYLGTGGAPWVSSQKLDAVSNQITLADRTLKNIIESERLAKENRELGRESNAEVFTRQMKILQDDLDGKVNKTVQSALNQFNSAELEGKLDTIPEIEAFQQQLYAQLDGDLSSIMDTNIEARKFLIERYDKLAESQKAQMTEQAKQKAEYEKNANTLNKDMSNALGYYVNQNGDALVDKTTGQQIVVPPETTTNYDASTGQMILMTKNRDGTIGVQIKQVWAGKPTTPKWERDPTTGGYYDANSSVSPTNQMAGTPQGLLDYISASEGTRWNYNAMYGKWGQTDINLTGMTINQIQDLQRKNIYQDKNGNYVGGAMGKYQIVSGTLNWLKQRLGLTGNELFDEEMQDKMAMSLIGNSYADYQAGKITADQLQNKVSGIWAGVPNTKWVSTYASDWTNKARADNGAFLQAIGWVWKQNTDQQAEAMALVQGLWGTEWERASYAKNIMDRANKKWISLIEAKKDLGYKTSDDKNFEETRKQQYVEMKKWYSESTWNAKTALTLLNEPQTAIGDVASVVWFLKTIDPASVARESEVAAVENARWVIDSLSNVFQKAKEWTKLTDTQRQQLKASIQTIVDAQDKKFLETVYDMKKEFDTRWLDATVYIPKTYIDKAQKEFGKAEEAKKKLGWFSLTDILSKLP